MNVKEFDKALWTYRARFEKVVDGDTVSVYIDKGGSDYSIWHIRLLDFNRPERNTKEGRIATGKMLSVFHGERYTGAMLEMHNWPLRVVTLKRDDGGDQVKSFERWIGSIYLCSESGEMTNLTDLL